MHSSTINYAIKLIVEQ